MIGVSAIKYTRYSTSNPKVHPELDDEILEETNQSFANPFLDAVRLTHPLEVTDVDGDGFREVRKSELEAAIRSSYLSSEPVPFASFFDDGFAGRSEAAVTYEQLPALLAAAKGRDFDESREIFAGMADPYNPLMTVSEPLAFHLAATAMHAGVNVSDSVRLDTKSGFSVAGDGRLKFDCLLFAELGESNLSGITGLKFKYVDLGNPEQKDYVGTSSPISGVPSTRPKRHSIFGNEKGAGTKPGSRVIDFEKPGKRDNIDDGRHVILLVSDGNGHNLIVDNSSVIYFESNDPMGVVRDIYGSRHSEINIDDLRDRTE